MQKYGVGSFSNIYIKQKLIAKYTDSVNFIEKTGRGRSSIIILDMMKHVIIDEWYTNRLENCHEESIRIIKMAAKLLKSSIKKNMRIRKNFTLRWKISNMNLRPSQKFWKVDSYYD